MKTVTQNPLVPLHFHLILRVDACMDSKYIFSLFRSVHVDVQFLRKPLLGLFVRHVSEFKWPHKQTRSDQLVRENNDRTNTPPKPREWCLREKKFPRERCERGGGRL
jgi:hypothetical protein